MDTDDLDQLIEQRRQLQQFCEPHLSSVLAFSFADNLSFKENVQEKEDPTRTGVRHLTSSATCIESLLACPDHAHKDADSRQEVRKRAGEFAKLALERKDWRSDESGPVYCRCRALPIVAEYLESVGESDQELIRGHLQIIFKQVTGTFGKPRRSPGRFAIGEWNPDAPADSYPENAYHTYWALKALKVTERKDIRCVPAGTGELLLVWARMKLGNEAALHAAASPSLDSDQLAWAITILLAFDDSLPADLASQDLITEALAQLFSTQQKNSGTWRHYRPLFHYRKSGNAYCYNFETFATMLGVALERYKKSESQFYLDVFRRHATGLHRLFEHARRTRQQLPGTPTYGWSSGHRSNSAAAESWATASVFSFAQALRRLVGIWTRNAALTQLHTVQVEDPETARGDMEKRGNSWSSDGRPVREQLQTLFVNPFHGQNSFDLSEPDSAPIEDDQCRSAILFGPPGTSKTTLARAVAGQLGWKFVELHSSHFVAEGLDGLQRVADKIFRELMQLDHTVVLFDEVDELVRGREDGSTDHFGRFLTTSMLPRLAELWKKRKVIYFINTNFIKYFDSAITRSERFDALIFVPPPSFEAKRDRLLEIMETLEGGKPDFQVTSAHIEEAFGRASKGGGPSPSAAGASEEPASSMPNEPGQELDQPFDKADVLAKFKLARYDQLRELAELLLGESRLCPTITQKTLGDALLKLHDAELEKSGVYIRFAADEAYSRRDFGRLPVYEVDTASEVASDDQRIYRRKHRRWIRGSMDYIKRFYNVESVGTLGKVKLKARPS
jgi:ATPase family associated with various cellular activities (AAA)